VQRLDYENDWRFLQPLRLTDRVYHQLRQAHQNHERVHLQVMPRATIDGGGQSPGPVTAACTVELSDGSFHENVKRFDQGSHNTAEWHALILGLRVALKHGERHVVVKGDSMLVVKHINREWKTKNAALLSLRAQAEELFFRDLARRVDSAQGEPAHRRVGTVAISPGPSGVRWRRPPLRTTSGSAASLALPRAKR
jgi:ribonuclease HI